MKKIKFAILGLGRVINIRGLKLFSKDLKFSKVDIVFDKDKKKTLETSNFFKCKPAKNFLEVLKSDVDYVYIATESGNHYHHILKCLKYNKNVIVEKPPVLKVNQLVKLERIASKRKLDFFSIFQNRENKSVRYLKSILKKNKEKIIFAELSLIWSRPQSYYNDWHGKWKMDGGVLAQQGIHYIDLLNFLIGQPIKCISHTSNKTNKLQAEDTHSSLIIFKKNISCTVNLSTGFRPNDFEASIKIFCRDKIFILHGLCCNKISFFDLKKYKKKSLKDYSENVSNGYGNSHKEVFQNIINYKLGLKRKKNLKPLNAIDTLCTIKLLNMLYKSAEDRRWINYNNNNLTSKLGN